MRYDLSKLSTKSLPCRVLVVEDDLTIRKIHQKLLTVISCEVDCVSQGQHALHQLHYDMMFLDLGLPDIAEDTVIETVCAREAKPKPLPIIVLTAHGEERKTPCLSLGADRVLIKSVDKENLQSVLCDYCLLEKK